MLMPIGMSPTTTIEPLLDQVFDHIRNGHVPQAFQDLIVFLRSQRLSSTPEEWKQKIDVARRHPLMPLIQQDPFTRRCFQKPNGYPGDATLLDLIYSVEDPTWRPTGLSSQAQSLFDWTTRHAAPQAVRNRRRCIAELVDSIAAAIPQPRILTIAAGHLREAALSNALREGAIGAWIATDQDPHSLATIRQDYGHTGVETDTLPIMSLLRQRQNNRYEPFHFVYAAGLYDYLNLKTGSRLLRVMFDMLHPGGTVLITNFAEAIPDVGYMECYMDWHLTYRSVEDMLALTTSIPSQQIAQCKLFTDQTETLLYLKLTKQPA